jgi:hypothetical protein
MDRSSWSGPVSSGHLDDLPPWARALERERAGHLGLIDGDGQPRVQPRAG